MHDGGGFPVAKPVTIDRRLIRIPEALARSGYSRSTFYRKVAEGRIILKKCGKSSLVDLASLDADIDALPEAAVGSKRAA
jgi:hypothetical protein